MNDFIHRLTGRLDDFLEPLLNHGLAGDPPADHAELRQWLGLKERRSDAFVRALLVAAEAYPEDCPMDLWFGCCDLPLETWSVVGATLTPTSQQAADILYRPTMFPFPVTFELRYLDAGRMDFRAGGSSETVAVSTAGSSLAVAWPAWTGMTGALKLHQAWDPEFQAVVTAPPVSFPYEALQREVLKRSDATALLQARGVLDAVFSALNPVRAAALITRALTD